jgi:hypothetical protein
VEYEYKSNNHDPNVKYEADQIIRQNNARGINYINKTDQSLGKNYVKRNRISIKKRAEKMKNSSGNKGYSTKSEFSQSRNFPESYNEYNLKKKSDAQQKNFTRYMDTVPQIRIHSHVSDQNSGLIDESEMNQSNYRVKVFDTFTKIQK